MISTEISFDIETSFVCAYPIGLPYFFHNKIDLFSVNKKNFEKVMSLVNKYMSHLCSMEFCPLFKVDYPEKSESECESESSDSDSYNYCNYYSDTVKFCPIQQCEQDIFQNSGRRRCRCVWKAGCIPPLNCYDKNISIICKPFKPNYKKKEEDFLLLGKIYPNVVPQLNFDPDIFDASWIKNNHFEKECQILESLIKRLPGITLDKNHKEIHKIIKKTPIVEKSFSDLFSKEEMDKIVIKEEKDYTYNVFDTD